ncbi:LuxR C-terminal-related transcriptional regulator [Sodalis endosymbiont of Spalangia cameroni]|uniref:helix-turn-helix transcriptional regulator n=1 Tax=Sodalis praecaptivus TaxID=1239307 RepID=UPI0031F92C81
MSQIHSKDLSLQYQGSMEFFEWFCGNPVIHWNVGIMLVKNLNHEFIASNSIFSNYSGYDPKSLVGLNDGNMPWAENKDIYINHEKDVIAGLNYNVIEPLCGVVKASLFTSKRVVYTRSGVPAGTLASAIVFNGSIEFGHLAGTASNMKVSDYSGFNLTVLESKVLFFLLKGFSRKKISELVGVSTSSHDFHLMNIKDKFKVDTRDQLVSFCYERGFHEVVPFYIVC